MQEEYWETNPPLNHFYSNTLPTLVQKELPESIAQFLRPWFKERTQLIQAWHQALDGSIKQQNIEQAVTQLCQVLMDYVSAGHFEIYEKLVDDSKEFNDRVIHLAEPIYQRISSSTEKAICFNEKYSTEKNCGLRKKKLPYELSKLGEALEERFEAEDQLVKFLTQLHQQ